MLERVPRFADLLELSLAEQMVPEGFETKSANGRPLGPPDFIAMFEQKLGRAVQPGWRGRRPKADQDEEIIAMRIRSQ